VEEQLRKNHIPIMPIAELQQKAERMVGKPEPVLYEKKIVAVVEYRDGTIMDVVRQVKL
jgi:citrate lyase subunit alpha/citrate CoA-transferase